MRFFVTCIIAIVLWGCASSSSTSLSGVPPVPATPIRDELIVPGHRIGPVSLGMTLQDLYRTMGNSTSSDRSRDGFRYEFGSLIVDVLAANQKVMSITTTGSHATREGIGIGSSELAVRATYGTPTRISKNRSSDGRLLRYTFCYSQGIGMNFHPGIGPGVDAIMVWSPGC